MLSTPRPVCERLGRNSSLKGFPQHDSPPGREEAGAAGRPRPGQPRNLTTPGPPHPDAHGPPAPRPQKTPQGRVGRPKQPAGWGGFGGAAPRSELDPRHWAPRSAALGGGRLEARAGLATVQNKETGAGGRRPWLWGPPRPSPHGPWCSQRSRGPVLLGDQRQHPPVPVPVGSPPWICRKSTPVRSPTLSPHLPACTPSCCWRQRGLPGLPHKLDVASWAGAREDPWGPGGHPPKGQHPPWGGLRPRVQGSQRQRHSPQSCGWTGGKRCRRNTASCRA